MNIGKDKLLHYIAGTLIVAFFLIVSTIQIAILALIVIAGAKELLWDKLLKKGCCEWLDFLATLLGGFVVLSVVLK